MHHRLLAPLALLALLAAPLAAQEIELVVDVPPGGPPTALSAPPTVTLGTAPDAPYRIQVSQGTLREILASEEPGAALLEAIKSGDLLLESPDPTKALEIEILKRTLPDAPPAAARCVPRFTMTPRGRVALGVPAALESDTGPALTGTCRPRVNAGDSFFDVFYDVELSGAAGADGTLLVGLPPGLTLADLQPPEPELAPVTCGAGAGQTVTGTPLDQFDRSKYTHVSGDPVGIPQPTSITCAPTAAAMALVHFASTGCTALLPNWEELVRDPEKMKKFILDLAQAMGVSEQLRGATPKDIALAIARYIRERGNGTGWTLNVHAAYQDLDTATGAWQGAGGASVPWESKPAIPLDDLAREISAGQNVLVAVGRTVDGLGRHMMKLLAVNTTPDGSGNRRAAFLDPFNGGRVVEVTVDESGDFDYGNQRFYVQTYIALSPPPRTTALPETPRTLGTPAPAIATATPPAGAPLLPGVGQAPRRSLYFNGEDYHPTATAGGALGPAEYRVGPDGNLVAVFRLPAGSTEGLTLGLRVNRAPSDELVAAALSAPISLAAVPRVPELVPTVDVLATPAATPAGTPAPAPIARGADVVSVGPEILVGVVAAIVVLAAAFYFLRRRPKPKAPAPELLPSVPKKA
jgi:hypothetical protein